MGFVDYSHAQGSEDGDEAHYLIFVDVDGVLNIGAKDPGHSPLVFSDANMERTFQIQKFGDRRNLELGVNTLLAVYNRNLGHPELDEKSTYAHFMCSSETSLCTAFVQRLARIIQVAGAHGKCTVVLSSTWRRPKHRDDVRVLEQQLSQALGQPFAFDAHTPLGNERGKEGRLRSLGDFLVDFREGKEGAMAKKLYILVLEDFCITPVHHPQAVEDFLCECTKGRRSSSANDSPEADIVSVCLVHTYDTWTTADGSIVEIGCGLTAPHLCRALRFLGEPCDSCGRSSEVVAKSNGLQDVVAPIVKDVSRLSKDNFSTQDLPKQGFPWLLHAICFLKVMASLLCSAEAGHANAKVENVPVPDKVGCKPRLSASVEIRGRAVGSRLTA